MSASDSRREFQVGRVFGIPIRMHLSWLLFGGALAACLAVIHARSGAEVGWATAVGFGLVTAVCFAASVVAHELAHAVVAARNGREAPAIRLEFAGGRTEVGDGPESAGAEFRIALAGPLITLALLIALVGLMFADWLPPAGVRIAEHLALMNGLLLAFNLIPALPLDGGRLLRAMLWKIWDQPAAASRAAAASGRAFSLLLMALGALGLFAGGGGARILVGVWFLLMGIHLRRVSREVTRHLWLGEALAGLEAGHVLDYRVRAVQQNAPVREIEEQQPEFPEIPVVDESRLLGSVRLEDVRSCPGSRRETATAADLMRPEILRRTLAPGDAALRAFALLSSGDARAVAIVDRDALVGVVTMEALNRRLALRLTEGQGN